MAHGNELLKTKYWFLKLPKDWFKNVRIKKLRRLAGGDTMTIIYLKLLILSINHDARFIYEGVEPTIEEEIALKIDENVENVKLTLAYLKSCGLWQETEMTDEFLLPEAKGMAGNETYGNILRKNKQLGLANCKPLANQWLASKDIDIEKDIDIDTDKSNNKDLVNNSTAHTGTGDNDLF